MPGSSFRLNHSPTFVLMTLMLDCLVLLTLYGTPSFIFWPLAFFVLLTSRHTIRQQGLRTHPTAIREIVAVGENEWLLNALPKRYCIKNLFCTTACLIVIFQPIKAPSRLNFFKNQIVVIIFADSMELSQWRQLSFLVRHLDT